MKINCFAIYCSVTITLNFVLMLMQTATGVRGDDWSASCASNCTCKWTNGKKSAICSSLQLTAVPTTLSTELQVLVLNENHIHYLNREVFTNLGLLNLQRIYLKKSEVQYVHKETFKNLKILVEIDLSDNKIEMLDKDTFLGNDRLRIIYLSGNPLKRLVAYQFPILPHLRTLDLHDCLIGYIDPMAMANLNMLEFLYLKNNLLENLSEYVFQHMTNLKTLTLEDNPWQCNCKLRKFRNWYINSRVSSVSLLCKGPPAQKDKLWERVDEKQYGCTPKVEIFNNEEVHEMEIGSNTSFGCLVYGDPLPEVSWSLNGKILDNDNVLFDTETISSDKLWYNLTVYNMTSFDAGIYVCTGHNLVGHASQNISIYLSEIVQHVLVKTPETFWYFGLIMGTFGTVFLLVTISFIVCFCKRTSRQRHRHPIKTGVKPSVSFNDQEKKLLDLSITTTTADRGDSCGLVDNHTTATAVTTLSKADSGIGFQPIEVHTESNGMNNHHGRHSQVAQWGHMHYQQQSQSQSHHAHLTAVALPSMSNGCTQHLTAPDGTCSSVEIPTSGATGLVPMGSSQHQHQHQQHKINEEFPLNVGVFPPPPEFCSNLITNPAYGNIFISVSVTQDMLDNNELNMYPDLLNIPKRMSDVMPTTTTTTAATITATTTTTKNSHTMSPISMAESSSHIASFATLPRNNQRRGILKKDSSLQYRQKEHQQHQHMLAQSNLYPHDEIVSYHNLDTSYSAGYQEYQQKLAKDIARLPPPPPPHTAAPPPCQLPPPPKCFVRKANGIHVPTSCSTPPLDGTPLHAMQCNNGPTQGGSAFLKYDNMGRRITASGNSTLSLPDEERMENETTFFNEPANQMKMISNSSKLQQQQQQQQQQQSECIIREEEDEMSSNSKNTIDTNGVCNNVEYVSL